MADKAVMRDNHGDTLVLPFTGERFTPEITGQLALEHVHRYAVAREMAFDKIVLDIACGEGYGSWMLAERAAEVIGVDIDQEVIAHASRRYVKQNLHFQVGSCSAIPVKTNSVDLVVSFETIEHHDQHDAMMKEIKRVLKDEGMLIISSPDKYEYSERTGYTNPHHIKELYRNEFESLLDAYFKHKVVLGQKILYGSAILAEKGDADIRSYSIEDGGTILSHNGIVHPQYLIAVASDSVLSRLKWGIFEAPITESELARQYAEILHERDQKIVELSHAIELRIRGSDETAAGLAQSIQAREEEIRRLEEVNVELKRSACERDREISRLGAQVGKREGEIAELHRVIAGHERQINALADNEAGLKQRLSKVMKTLRKAEAEIAKTRSSTSWRITYPLRLMKEGFCAIGRDGGAFWGIMRVLYHLIPLSAAKQESVKEALYSVFPSIFSRLESFKMMEWRRQITSRVAQISVSETPLVSVIIPVYGQIEFTLRCLLSVAECTPHVSFEILVVDDHSPDVTQYVLKQLSNIRLISNDKNLGFIRSCNKGAAESRGDYLCFLNNDAEVKPGWLDELVRTFHEFPETGFVGSKLVYPNGNLQEAGGIIWRDGSAWNFGRGQDPEHPMFNYAREVDYCSGASIMVPKRLFQELGGFDEHYLPAYGEDSDLALKIRSRGLSVIYQPLSVVVHHEGATSGTDVSAGTKAYQVDNARKLFERWKQHLSAHQNPGEDVDAAKDRMAKWRVLVVDHCTPTPDQDAGSITAFNFMLLLRQAGFQVTFIPEDNYLYVPPYTEDLQRVGVEVLYAPYITSVRHHLVEAADRYDLVLLVRPNVAGNHLEMVKTLCPRAKVLFHTSDVHFLRMEREAELENDASKQEAAVAMKAFELSLMQRVDEVVVHSTVEQELLQQEIPGTPVSVFQWAIPVRGTGAAFEGRRDVAFIGGYQHTPNVDAALYFIREVFPILQSRIPGIRFFAIGSKPPQELLELSSDNIIVTGFVEDLSPLLDTIRVAVAPLRYGAGIKGKVATALSVGLPCVATEIAAEGMGLTDGQEILVGYDADDFATKVDSLYRDQALWERISRQGIDFAERTYGQRAAWCSIAHILEKLGFSVSQDDRSVVLVGPETARRV